MNLRYPAKCRFLSRLLVIVLPASIALSAAEPPKLPAELQKLVDLATSAPPEFAADALLRIVEAGKVENRDLKRGLVEQAFQFAGQAHQPMRLVPIPGSQVDTRSGYRAASMKLGLDAMSLECRAIRDMLALDPARARELFSSLVKPRTDPLSCDDALVPDFDGLYQTLQQIVASTFSPAERQKDEHVHLLTTYLSGITAQTELAPAARTIAALNLTPAQLEVAAGVFATKLETVPHDDRSFSVAAGPLRDAIASLALALAHQGLPTEGLVRGFRRYLVSSLSGARCEDNAGVSTHSLEPARVVEWFNTQFHGDVAIVHPDEIQPSSVEGSAKIEPYWQSGEAKQILADGKALRFSPQGSLLSPADRNTQEWKRSLSDFLTELDGWKPTDEASETDYFHEKAIAYEALLELTPPGEERDKIMTAYVAFIANSDTEQQSPVEWFWHAQDTLARLRNAGDNTAKLLAAYKNSGNVVLSLYATLDMLAPARPYYAR